MQSFVVGATGIVGGYIVEHLVRSGETPLALSRAQQRSSGVVWLQGDLAKPETLKPPSFEILYCTVDIALLADALPHIYTPALKRVVAFTSTGIVTKIESEVASERELLQRLAEGERRLISTCERYRVGCTILRPTIIYAEGRDGNISRLARPHPTVRGAAFNGQRRRAAAAGARGRPGDRRHCRGRKRGGNRQNVCNARRRDDQLS